MKNRDQLTLFAEAAPASPSPSLEDERAWMVSLASCTNISELWMRFARAGFSRRTSPAYFPSTEAALSASSSTPWKNSGMAWHGERSTLNSSEWPNAGVVASLSGTLETSDVPRRFYLTPRACAGILSRAERRGRPLPRMLEDALRAASNPDRERKRGGSASV